jgi:DNA repair exonuclease SbcCD nuclease subunit
VDFVVLAGDLFQQRAIDPPTLIQAITGLKQLKEAGIPVLAVEGNHERAHYRDVFSWVDFLADQGYLAMLNPTFEEGKPVLTPWDGVNGAYVDLPPASQRQAAGPVRVYGVKYYGSSTKRVVEGLVEALATMDHSQIEFVILIMHAGLDDVLDHHSATVSHRSLAPLKDYVNYLALGHIHKPYQREGWIYNPGSPETCSLAEVDWTDRGYYLVEIDTDDIPKHSGRLIASPRRSFRRLRLNVDTCASPEGLYQRAEQMAKAEAAKGPTDKPVVELALEGVLPFSPQDLDSTRLQAIVQAALDPLLVRFNNRTVPTEYEVSGDEAQSRAELERQVVQELLERDARYRPSAGAWTDLLLDVKRLVLEETSPQTIVDYLSDRTAEIQAE